MTELECGIKAFDVHELLCHFVASRHGYYDDEGIRVHLRDHTFTPDEQLPDERYFQVACGAAYLARRQGLPFKVVFVSVIRPMFWLHAAAEIQRIEDLANRRVATYPAFAPPYVFHRLLLRAHGLDPDRDVSFEPVRDDHARLGLLVAGEVQAAAVSSAISPVRVQRRGLTTLALFGDFVTMATTGIATTERMLAEHPDTVAGLVRAFRRALEDIHARPEAVVPVIAGLLDEPADVARATYDLVLPCFTRNGRVAIDELQAAIDTVGRELPGDAHVEASELYDFSLIDARAE